MCPFASNVDAYVLVLTEETRRDASDNQRQSTNVIASFIPYHLATVARAQMVCIPYARLTLMMEARHAPFLPLTEFWRGNGRPSRVARMSRGVRYHHGGFANGGVEGGRGTAVVYWCRDSSKKEGRSGILRKSSFVPGNLTQVQEWDMKRLEKRDIRNLR